ncbi:metallophosphoesterase [Litorilinea aerophila]|nr:metallophosphoesterase [Litorilinea aerophila]MCC9077967.1 metallophosphoesterase [Litorilinea aerophila]
MTLDRSFLPSASMEWVVIADTHFMLESDGAATEFSSRRQQSARTAFALELVAALDVPLVVHLGDLVQTFPERPDFPQAVDAACAQWASQGLRPRLVAGNHDVGDKPDPTMPTAWVTGESLAAYHRRFGRSWYSWDQGGIHFVVLNSQLLNSPLPAAAEQQRWCEADLAAQGDSPVVLFLHLPPYLDHPQEAGLGHYDNIDLPARSWLLELVARHRVELLFAAHVHFAFVDRLHGARYVVVPSVSFTRPGFGELFSSPPPPEQGRDDVAKLGFYLVRRGEDGDYRLHLIRTGGATGAATFRRLLTRVAPDLPHSPLGVSLRHPLAWRTALPAAWPSLVRQPARNDYPALACYELGVRHLRVPASDLEDSLQRERLDLLRREGISITATCLWRPGDPFPARDIPEMADTVEVVLLGTRWPDMAALAAGLETLARPVCLSVALPGQFVPGKQHRRTRLGYMPEELQELNARLAAAHLHVHRVLCRLDPAQAWATVPHLPLDSWRQIGAVDWLMEWPSVEAAAQRAAVEALAAVATQADSRLYGEPLMDLDRTMDVTPGLLDRLCNPRPLFHLLRHLNTLLFSSPERWHLLPAPGVDGQQVLGLARPHQVLWLLPEGDGRPWTLDARWYAPLKHGALEGRLYGLVSGQIQVLPPLPSAVSLNLEEPTALLLRAA